MKTKIIVLFLTVFLSYAVSGFAYDTETHALITRKAFSSSALASGQVYFNLGLGGFDSTNPLNAYWRTDLGDIVPYYYTDGSGLGSGPLSGSYLYPEAFERCQMHEFVLNQEPAGFKIFGDTVDARSVPAYPSDQPSVFDSLLPIQNWLVRGAIREDDTGWFSFATKPSPEHCQAEFVASSQGLTPRSLNHFYDPVSDSPLSPCAGGPCFKAVNWALGLSNSFDANPTIDPLRLNFYSYADARNLMWWALTRENNKANGQPPYGATFRQLDAEDRMHLWATTFRSLGDVVHLLEDMGQPQHTRNDAHASFNTGEKQAFEDYTNDRVLGVTDESNSYVRGFFGDIKHPFAPPPLGAYPVPMFSTPTRYFTTRGDGGDQIVRAGLADYTNRGFFTGGTLPGATSEPLPVPLDTSYTMVVTNCPDLSDADSRLNAVTCAHYTHTVPDLVAPTYTDQLPCYSNSDGSSTYCFTQPPLVADSIMREIVSYQEAGGVEQLIPQYAIGIPELDTMGNLTIPRAVAYAAGMINFFFRGQLKLSSPPDGLYAVLDQSVSHHLSNDGIPVLDDGVTTFGFKILRVRVKNNTMIDAQGNPTLFDAGFKSSVSQTMKAGTGTDGQPNGYLVAIARYHRNPCYRADLTGENVSIFNADGSISTNVPAGCSSVEEMRTSLQEISVSAKVSTDSNGKLPGAGSSSSPCANVGNINTGAGADTGDCQNDSALMEFDFSGDPIPINATDLYLQVAYRGQLGDETDGIAVGMIDIYEPNYLTSINSTDWTYDSDKSQWTHVDPDEQTPETQTKVCFNSQAIATSESLNVGDFVRLAYLTDQSTGTKTTLTNIDGAIAGVTAAIGPVPRQSDRENGGTFVNYRDDAEGGPGTGMWFSRGATTGDGWLMMMGVTDTDIDLPAHTIANDGVIEHLLPNIGVSRGAGMPIIAQTVQFTSETDPDCAAIAGVQGASRARVFAMPGVSSGGLSGVLKKPVPQNLQ